MSSVTRNRDAPQETTAKKNGRVVGTAMLVGVSRDLAAAQRAPVVIGARHARTTKLNTLFT